jgi:hypothetical protein
MIYYIIYCILKVNIIFEGIAVREMHVSHATLFASSIYICGVFDGLSLSKI